MINILKLLFLLILSVSISVCENSIKEVPTDMTIPENPLLACPESPNCYRVTRVFQSHLSVVKNAFKSTIDNENPFEVKIVDTGQLKTISATYKIPIFGWIDDVEIEFEADHENKNSTFVYLKSSSREGYYDLGVNKRRIKRILKKAHNELNLK